MFEFLISVTDVIFKLLTLVVVFGNIFFYLSRLIVLQFACEKENMSFIPEAEENG